MKQKQTLQEKIKGQIESLKNTPEFMLEDILLEVAAQISLEMEKQEISKSELARRMNKKPPFITRVLKGENNLTFSTAAQVAHALGLEIQVSFRKKRDLMQNQSNEPVGAKSKVKKSLRAA